MTNPATSPSEHRQVISDSADPDKGATCRVLQAAAQFVSKQEHLLAPGISAQSVGSQRIHLQIATIPPGARAKAHKHADHETSIYVLSGESGMWYGEKLERHLVARAGDFLYIPANVPHLPYNLSELESCIALIARTDPDEQESVVLLPELDAVHEPRSVKNHPLNRRPASLTTKDVTS
jgi:uncharacterized RmlC-like cupin family protein